VKAIALGPKPIIAAVEGTAVGGGLSIASACDLIVAAEDARFGIAFTTLGLMPDLGLIYTLSERVGKQVARRMIYLSEKLSGTEAFTTINTRSSPRRKNAGRVVPCGASLP